jgi:hypothetical protein
MPYVQHTLALRRNVSASHRLPFCGNLALLIRRPTAAALASCDHLDAPIASVRKISCKSVLGFQRHGHHPIILPQGRQVARFSSRRAMCSRDVAY